MDLNGFGTILICVRFSDWHGGHGGNSPLHPFAASISTITMLGISQLLLPGKRVEHAPFVVWPLFIEQSYGRSSFSMGKSSRNWMKSPIFRSKLPQVARVPGRRKISHHSLLGK